jgi:excinuclease ABC subunit A
MNVGLEYLALSRSSKSLSGGEHPTSNTNWFTVGVLYILDEPSIVLQRDNDKLIPFEQLRDISVIVVEHDKDMIERADYVIDIGQSREIWRNYQYRNASRNFKVKYNYRTIFKR